MLTKKEKQDLKLIAKVLPEEKGETTQKITLHGWQLISQGVFIEANGKPIVRSKKYLVDQKKPVNHYKKMLDAYDKGGLSAIEAYCKEVESRWDNQQKAKENSHGDI